MKGTVKGEINSDLYAYLDGKHFAMKDNYKDIDVSKIKIKARAYSYIENFPSFYKGWCDGIKENLI